MDVRISVKNYRCFGFEPQIIQFGEGFTAFVGLNNAGKSAILKMFYELRPLWRRLENQGSLGLLTGDTQTKIQLLGVQDAAEIFNHFTRAPIELGFSIKNEHGNVLEFTVCITNTGSSDTVLVSIRNQKVDGEVVKFTGHSSYIDGKKISIGYNTPKLQTSLEASFFLNFFKALAESVYLPSFRNLINVGENDKHYDIATGTAFIRQWDEWKAGVKKFEKEQVIKITDDIKGLFGYKNLEINASANKKTLGLTIDGKPYTLQEVGSGLAQFILAFATVATKTPSYIFIDEPELNLHPALQLKFLTNLGSYASLGVVFATHSLGLARSVEKVFSVTKDDLGTTIKPFSNTPNYSTLLGELSFSAYKEIGADCILFVEGITEVRTMQELLRKFGKDNKVLVMNLGGDDMINGKRELEISEITNRIDVRKVYAWIDSEKTSESDLLSKNREGFSKVCGTLDITCGISERRAIENYFTQRAIDVVFPGRSFKSLGLYDTSDSCSAWSKSENWKLAREMSREELEETDLGKFVSSIV